jgi:hypothetical protein
LAKAHAWEWLDAIRHPTGGIHFHHHVAVRLPERQESAMLPKQTGLISFLPPDVLSEKGLSISTWGTSPIPLDATRDSWISFCAGLARARRTST